MLENGVIPIPPARNTAGLAEFLCSVKEPIAESMFTTVPSGIFFSERFNAVSRMRVANLSWSSNGALAIEKVRTFPSASVSGGFSNVAFNGLLGLEIKCRRLLKLKGHSSFRSVSSIQELGCVSRYRDSFSSHDQAYGWYPSFCHWVNNAR